MIRNFAFLFCVLLCSCSRNGVEKLEAHAKIMELSGSSVKLVLSAADKPACISAADLSPYYGRIRVFGKYGKEIQKSIATNRELQIYNGMDVADGVIVVSAGKPKTILISLSEFEAGGDKPVRGNVEFSYSSCYLLFDREGRSVRSMRVNF